MKASTRLYAWLKLLTVLHLVEQLIFGMQDLHALKNMIAAYDRCFSNPGSATVTLLTIGAGLASLAIYCILRGGWARLIASIVLGLPAIGELHHLVETAHAGRYTSGTVTAVPSIICGVLFLRALVRECRGDKLADGPAALEPAVAL